MYLKTLPPNGPFASNSFFFSAKNSKVAIIKTKRATIAFFTFPPHFPLALFFSAILILRYCDFQLIGPKIKAFLLTPFHSNDCNFR